MDKITVVTVTYNAEKDIEFTMRSVLDQDYFDMEYLIIDGKSVDNTVEIAKSVKSEYPQRHCCVISEKDKGIYDAMNKAAKLATGDWIIFMNAGDCFYQEDCISSMFSDSISDSVSAVYGDTERFMGDWSRVVKAHPLKEIANSILLPFCHQSVFVRSGIMKELLFDTTYRQAADYDFFVRCYKRGLVFFHKDLIVSRYSMGGISETSTVRQLREKLDIREKSGLEHYSKIRKRYLVKRLAFRQLVKKMMPQSVLKKIRGY